jgi:hypothetical protein
MSNPLILSGSYTGNGKSQLVPVGFTPDFVWIKSNDAVGYPVFRANSAAWFGRNHFFAPFGSERVLTDFRDNGFTINSGADVNAAGVTYYWFAVADNGSGMLKQLDICGNGQNRTVTGWLNARPSALWFKRDNLQPGAYWDTTLPANVALPFDGTATFSGVTSAATNGDISVTGDAHVNQLVPPLSGEHCAWLAWFQNSYLAIGSYTGNGTSQQINVGFQPEAVMVFRQDAVSGAAFAFASMPAGNAAVTAGTAAPTTTRVNALNATGFALGASASANAAGVQYSYMAFKKNASDVLAAPPYRLAYRKAVLLNGLGSNIACGTSDTLRLSGAMSLEFMGTLTPNGANVYDIPLIHRGRGDAGGPATAGSTSWGLGLWLNPLNNTIDNHSGYTLRVGCSNFWDIYQNGVEDQTYTTGSAGNPVFSPFNTGILILPVQRVHIFVTHDGAGHWRTYINGMLRKDRQIDMTVQTPVMTNLASASGHPTVIGARTLTNGTLKSSSAMNFELARVYSVELTAAQVAQRYRRAYLAQAAIADVATGLVEEWDANNAVGTSLPATVNAANNGTITGGAVITV